MEHSTANRDGPSVTETADEWLRGRSVHSVETLGKRSSHILGGTEQGSSRFRHTTQKRVQFNTCELFVSGMSCLAFSDSGAVTVVDCG